MSKREGTSLLGSAQHADLPHSSSKDELTKVLLGLRKVMRSYLNQNPTRQFETKPRAALRLLAHSQYDDAGFINDHTGEQLSRCPNYIPGKQNDEKGTR